MSEKSVGESIAFAFKDLSVQYHGKHLVEKVTGYVRKNCITAILGPSAAGKSVLLQAVAGHIQDLDIGGKVYMDGREVNPKLLDNPVAYVPQYDSLIGELTAREMTRNTALLKRNDPLEKIEKDVDELLKKLGLGHVADGIIGTLIFRGLSGGQKKRVQVATELIASPSILLLDEPTSGLDSSAAYEALSCVRDLVKDGKHNLSVMLTIHQPNSKLLSLFDDIMVMESGQTTFFGPLPRAIDHFAQCGFTCPADELCNKAVRNRVVSRPPTSSFKFQTQILYPLSQKELTTEKDRMRTMTLRKHFATPAMAWPLWIVWTSTLHFVWPVLAPATQPRNAHQTILSHYGARFTF